MARRAAAVGAAALGATALVRRLRRERRGYAEKTLTINKPADEVRRAWVEISGDESALHMAPAPGGRGTEVTLERANATKGDVTDELRRFKQLVEAGEAASADGPRG